MSRILRGTASAYSGLAGSRRTPGVCATCWSGFALGRTRPSANLAPAPHVPTRALFSSDAVEFEQTVYTRFRQAAPSRRGWGEVEKEMTAFGIKNMSHLEREERLFMRSLRGALSRKSPDLALQSGNSVLHSLRFAYIRGDVKGLSSQIHYLFRNFLLRDRFSKPVTAAQRRLMDLRYPWEWFPATRTIQRTIHLHIGPTNSGKTYHALKALENAETGVYCGPLRLLAHEVHSRLVAKGKSCALITGEEQRYPEDTDRFFMSCTVEMTPMNQLLDVAVIDEIQMLADPDRGPAWTAAFLGVQAKEVHLCGEERTVDLIKSICASIGENCIVHRYKRLTPLKAAPKSLMKRFDKLEKGDCIVTFSKMTIHAIKAAVERETGRRCAIIYGSLPPRDEVAAGGAL